MSPFTNYLLLSFRTKQLSGCMISKAAPSNDTRDKKVFRNLESDFHEGGKYYQKIDPSRFDQVRVNTPKTPLIPEIQKRDSSYSDNSKPLCYMLPNLTGH